MQEYQGICQNMPEYEDMHEYIYIYTHMDMHECVGICRNRQEYAGICTNMVEYVRMRKNTQDMQEYARVYKNM